MSRRHAAMKARFRDGVSSSRAITAARDDRSLAARPRSSGPRALTSVTADSHALSRAVSSENTLTISSRSRAQSSNKNFVQHRRLCD